MMSSVLLRACSRGTKVIDFGHGVTLGPLKLDSLWTYYSWRNDRRIWSWCRQNDVLQPWDHEAWFHSLSDRDDVKMYEVLEGPLAVGVCGLTDLDYLNSRAEFSLYIEPSMQGHGLGRQALRTLVDHGFQNYNLNQIWGETYDGNPAMAMFIDIGFRHDATRREFYFRDGRYVDAHLVSVTRAEWFTSPCI